MDNEMKSLKELWEQTRPVAPAPLSITEIREKAAANKRSSVIFQYSNIAILFSFTVLIYLYLGVWYPYRTILGQTGVWLMTGSLLARVLIELLSIYRSGKIKTDAQLLNNTNTALQYYEFRKKIHGPITYVIVAIYTAGFYILMPEFTSHAPTWLSILVMLSYPLGAVVMIFQIRKGIRKEIAELKELSELQENILRNKDIS